LGHVSGHPLKGPERTADAPDESGMQRPAASREGVHAVDLPRPIPDLLVRLLAAWLQVLAQPVRIRIIDVLDRQGETSVSDLAEAIAETPYNTSQDLSVLLRAGVVRRRRCGRAVLYRLTDRAPLRIYELAAAMLAGFVGRLGRQFGDDTEAGSR